MIYYLKDGELWRGAAKNRYNKVKKAFCRFYGHSPVDNSQIWVEQSFSVSGSKIVTRKTAENLIETALNNCFWNQWTLHTKNCENLDLAMTS